MTSGKIDLQEMQKFLEELELRAGGVRSAARLVGVSHQTYLRWLGRIKWNNQKIWAQQRNMTRDNAALVLTTLVALRRTNHGEAAWQNHHQQILRKQAAREERFLRQIGCG